MNSRDKHEEQNEERLRVIAQNGNDGLHYEENKSPEHYDNSKGTLYKISDDLGLNSWEYDVFKHLVRCRKKGEWLSDIDKCIDILNLYKKEKWHLYKNEVEVINNK